MVLFQELRDVFSRAAITTPLTQKYTFTMESIAISRYSAFNKGPCYQEVIPFNSHRSFRYYVVCSIGDRPPTTGHLFYSTTIMHDGQISNFRQPMAYDDSTDDWWPTFQKKKMQIRYWKATWTRTPKISKLCNVPPSESWSKSTSQWFRWLAHTVTATHCMGLSTLEAHRSRWPQWWYDKSPSSSLLAWPSSRKHGQLRLTASTSSWVHSTVTQTAFNAKW